MKCCVCNAECETTVNRIPPEWFGMYGEGGRLIKCICRKCLNNKDISTDWNWTKLNKKESK